MAMRPMHTIATFDRDGTAARAAPRSPAAGAQCVVARNEWLDIAIDGGRSRRRLSFLGAAARKSASEAIAQPRRVCAGLGGRSRSASITRENGRHQPDRSPTFVARLVTCGSRQRLGSRRRLRARLVDSRRRNAKPSWAKFARRHDRRWRLRERRYVSAGPSGAGQKSRSS